MRVYARTRYTHTPRTYTRKRNIIPIMPYYTPNFVSNGFICFKGKSHRQE